MILFTSGDKLCLKLCNSTEVFFPGGESLARKGFGRVRIEPQENLTVDVFLTHTCANDENNWCRDAQILQLVGAVRKSAADFVILGGDFNLDPRANETGYHTLKEELIRYR